jgi:hypothetical protein
VLQLQQGYMLHVQPNYMKLKKLSYAVLCCLMVQVLVGMPSIWTINHEFTNLVLGRVVAGFSLCAAAVREVT